MKIVDLGPLGPVELGAPHSFQTRNDVLVAYNRNNNRGAVAALGLCIAKPSPKKLGIRSSFSGSGFDAGQFGGDLADELVALGVPYTTMLSAGWEAIQLIVEAHPAPAEDEVAEEVGNSGAARSGADAA